MKILWELRRRAFERWKIPLNTINQLKWVNKPVNSQLKNIFNHLFHHVREAKQHVQVQDQASGSVFSDKNWFGHSSSQDRSSRNQRGSTLRIHRNISCPFRFRFCCCRDLRHSILNRTRRMRPTLRTAAWPLRSRTSRRYNSNRRSNHCHSRSMDTCKIYMLLDTVLHPGIQILDKCY